MAWEFTPGARGLRQRCATSALALAMVSAGSFSMQAQDLFEPAQFYVAGDHPVHIVIGAFNDDAFLDLVTVNEYASTVSVLQNEGEGYFGPPSTYPVGGGPQCADIGDLNDDQLLDLVVSRTGGGGRISVLLGEGHGAFAPAVSYPCGPSPEGIALGDLNGDRLLDLAVANWSADHVSVLLGNGDGTFGAPSTYAAGSMPEAVAIGDFNGDQAPDLAAAVSNADRAAVLFGYGDGTFGPPMFYPVGDQPTCLVVADFNGDAAPDLALGCHEDTGADDVAVLLNRGDGTFEPSVVYWIDSGSWSLAVGDFNLDRALDLVAAELACDDVAVLPGVGDGTFEQHENYLAGDGARAVAVGDLDGDQVPDLAVANQEGDDVAVLLGTTHPADVKGTRQPFASPRLLRVSPNPVAPSTMIEFDLPEPARTRLLVFDATGRAVGCILDQWRPAGTHRVPWERPRSSVTTIASGAYCLRLEARGRQSVQAIAILR